jgi:uncharacterized protein
MTTFTGQKFHLLNPSADEVHLEDIAHALALENRFCGATPKPYSVAQHSVLVSYRAERIAEASYPEHQESIRRIALWGLFHDAAEAYLKDLHRPLKHALPEYEFVESRVMRVICEHFGLHVFSMPASVRQADNEILACELRDLWAAPRTSIWRNESQPAPNVHVAAWDWKDAEGAFHDRFVELTRNVGE